MNLFNWIFKSQSISPETILNSGLDLAMEFGKDWLQPIQLRLSKKYSQLSEAQLGYYNEICQQARDHGFKYIYDHMSMILKSSQKIKQTDLRERFEAYIMESYPWINKKNLKRLFDQGCYYAWKDGLMDSVE